MNKNNREAIAGFIQDLHVFKLRNLSASDKPNEQCKSKRSKNRTDITDGPRSAEINTNRQENHGYDFKNYTGRVSTFSDLFNNSHDLSLFLKKLMASAMSGCFLNV